MSDPRALVRVVDELLWVLRRERFVISIAQAIDVAGVFRLVGLEDGRVLRDALACIVVCDRRDRARFDKTFDAFFQARARPMGFWEKLCAEGFAPDEIEWLRTVVAELEATGEGAALSPILAGGADVDRLLALSGAAERLEAHAALRLGYEIQEVLSKFGSGHARGTLALVRMRLVEALGARGEALADAMARELDDRGDMVRAFAREVHESHLRAAEPSTGLERRPLVSLAESEAREVRHLLRRFGDRLAASARARKRRARARAVDPSRTLRCAMRTGGTPFMIVRRSRCRQRPRWFVLCDVSDSVRDSARFFLELASAAHDLFDRTRTFAFVSDLRDTTDVFDREDSDRAAEMASRSVAADNSNYGRALRAFEERYLGQVDRRTTVVILGDGRTNYHNPAANVLDAIRSRASALYWLCPEKRVRWLDGDSAMMAYAARCTAAFEVQSVADLERAMRAMIVR